MPIYSIHHATTYRYGRPVGFGEHRMMLRPRESHDQRVLGFDLGIAPRPKSIRWSADALGNAVGLARFSARAAELRFESLVRVWQGASHPVGFGVADSGRTLPVVFAPQELPDLRACMERPSADASVDDWAQTFLSRVRPTPTLECLTAVTQAIRRDFAYIRRSERGIQLPAETLARRSGTCRDYTVLMMNAVRSLGIPARFVSGYLYVPSRDRDNVRGGGATHAWAQAYLPGAGWIDFDPTNAGVGNAGLVRVAIAREPEAAIPLSGSFTGFRSDDLGMEVSVKVTREPCEDEECGGQSPVPLWA